MFKFVVEGYSDDSPEAALAEAMGKAVAYMSENHDVNIAILELAMLPEGGYRAVLEITVVPMSHRKTLHREGEDVELKRIYEREYRVRRKYSEAYLKKMVADHFALSLGNFRPEIPDFYYSHLSSTDLMNNMIEKQFFHAAHHPVDIPHRDEKVPPLKDVLGKPLKPAPEN